MLMCFKFSDAIIAAIISGGISVIGFLLIIVVQNKLLKKNQFESTFFNLLTNIREMANSFKGNFEAESQIRIEENKKKPPISAEDAWYEMQAQPENREIIAADLTPKGQEWFEMAASELNVFMEDYFTQPHVTKKIDKLEGKEKIEYMKEVTLQAYNDFQYNYAGQLWQYFRFIFNVMKFVDGSELSIKDKKFYMNFIQSQMSQSELVLWFYNGIWPGGKKFFDYLTIYTDFLQNLDTDRLYDGENFVKFYPDNIYRKDSIPTSNSYSGSPQS